MFIFKRSQLLLNLSPLLLGLLTVLLYGSQVLVLVSVDDSPQLIPLFPELLQSDLLAFKSPLDFKAFFVAFFELVFFESHL